ncbi:MAG: HAD hydrolase-like protein [Candidatus Helarchaeota archaeon]
MDKIKLVIWDLDETFWKGTLSEEGIVSSEYNIKLIKKLTDKGIMNAVVSKNDFNPTKKKLEELGVWDYIIFPHIDWLPKGELIKNIITKANLRAPNILFLDDNHINLKEADFYNKGIHTRKPDFIPKILDHPAFKGKDDKTHSRLKQYRILEEKEKDKKVFSDNTEFLRSSGIKVEFITNLKDNVDRLVELIERTNQLNFTKKRDSKNKVLEIITSSEFKCGALRVFDNYGDYGVVGFYAIRKKENTFEHFVFSCRTINIGIEQFIYDFLDYPKLDIIGEVSSNLQKNSKPDWITIAQKNNINDKKEINNKKISIFLKGGCDLDQMVHYLKDKSLNILTEFNHVDKGNHQIHREHSEFTLQSKTIDEKVKKEIVEDLPFLDNTVFETEIFNNSHDIVIYSLLMDYTQEIYINKKFNIKIAYGGYNNIIQEDPKELEKNFIEKGVNDMNEYFFNKFKDDYIYSGQISEDHFKNNISEIIKLINKPIIFINGAEINTPKDNKLEQGARNRHEKMNKVLSELVNKNSNCYLVDMRKLVSQDDITNNIRHYKRNIYILMSQEIKSIISKISNIKLNKKNSIVKMLLINSKQKLIKKINQFIK